MKIKQKLKKLFRNFSKYPKFEITPIIRGGQKLFTVDIETKERRYHLTVDGLVYDLTRDRQLTVGKEYPLAKENMAVMLKKLTAQHLKKHHPDLFNNDLAMQGVLKQDPGPVKFIKTKDGRYAVRKLPAPTPPHHR